MTFLGKEISYPQLMLLMIKERKNKMEFPHVKNIVRANKKGFLRRY
jgi:hypothetical protein